MSIGMQLLIASFVLLAIPTTALVWEKYHDKKTRTTITE